GWEPALLLRPSQAGEPEGDHDRPEDRPDEAESGESPQHAEENRERPDRGTARDEPRLQHVVDQDAHDQDAVEGQADGRGPASLYGERDGGRAPDERRAADR